MCEWLRRCLGLAAYDDLLTERDELRADFESLSGDAEQLEAQRDAAAAAVERCETAWRHIHAIATAASVDTKRGAPTRHKHYAAAAAILRHALDAATEETSE